MDLLTPKKTTTFTKVKYKTKRFLARKIKLYKFGSIPLWSVFAVVILVGIYQNIFSTTTSISSTTKSSVSNKKFSDKFDLTYRSLDKSKVSTRWISSQYDEPFQIGCVEPDLSGTIKKANASLVVLARNKELKGVIKSMCTLERHFNQWFNYPWVFLNDEEFTDKFKKTVKKYTKSHVEFGLIDKSLWDFPLANYTTTQKKPGDKAHDAAEFREFIERQGDRGIMYGSLDSYHKMCRFYSGGFYKHPLVRQYEWYWRVEPDVEFYCDLTYDPFIEMQKRGKKYGFTVIIKELSDTIPNLFRYTKSFVKEKNIPVKNAWNLFVNPINTFNTDEPQYQFIEEKDDLILELENEIEIEYLAQHPDSKDISKAHRERLTKKLVEKTSKSKIPKAPKDSFDGEKYNYCHFWSNFEIARVDLWDNPLYEDYFRYLEDSGGFYKERWGDAPVHSLAIAMFLDLQEIHYFRDIGYKHSTIAHCPHNSFDNQLGYSPAKNYFKYDDVTRIQREDFKWLYTDKPRKNGVGCRCKCPRKQAEIENTGGSCIEDWIWVNKNYEYGIFNKRKDGKYPRVLDVAKLKKLMKQDYELYVKRGGDASSTSKTNRKYISSAWRAYQEITKRNSEEGIRMSDYDFDKKLVSETAALVKERAVEFEGDSIMENLIGGSW